MSMISPAPLQTAAFAQATRARLLLSAYLDLVVLSVPWALIHYVAADRVTWMSMYSWPIMAILYLVAEVAFHKAIHWSPGDFLLSVRRTERVFGVPLVDSEVKQRENWFTLVVATLLLLEGCKSLVRWSMWSPPQPFFGLELAVAPATALAIVAGSIECVLAYYLFRVNRVALFLGAAYFVATAISVYLSADLLPAWGAEYVQRRREYQGLVASPVEIERMRKSAYPFALGGTLAYLLLLVLTAPRLLRKPWRSAA